MTFIGKVDILVKIKQDEGFRGNKAVRMLDLKKLNENLWFVVLFQDIMSIYSNVLSTI